MIERIRSGVKSKLRKEQAGFKGGRGTTEQMFVLKDIIGSQQWQTTLYVHFVDFEKGFDSVHRDSFWLIMQSYGIPSKIISMVKTQW